MSEMKHMIDCFLCRRSFQFGPHRYEGRRIPAWDIMVCETCYSANWDGVVLETHPQLETHLRSHGISIKRNAKGWIDFPQ